MKHLFLLTLFISVCISSFARHIIGGEVIYNYVGNATAGTRSYSITLRLFRDALNCNAASNCAVLPASVTMGIYDNDNNKLVDYVVVDQSNFTSGLPIISEPPCLQNEPMFSYEEAEYNFGYDLPNNNLGYTIVYQSCCRVLGIANGGSSEGATYTAEIPGGSTLGAALNDNSARFQTGISVICYNHPFKLDFSATDPDADSLVYSFIPAYNGGAATDAGFASPAPPPYGYINYYAPYSGFSPLGGLAVINSATGLITGTAPDAGKYVVSVLVKSYRNGQFIAQHRKDFIVTVAPCDFASADLPAEIPSCESFDKSFQNGNNSALNTSFFWIFGDPASGTADSSTAEMPTHHYSGPGNYQLELIVNRGELCADTAYSIVKVFPGFFSGVKTIPPMCKDLPVQFTDSTTTNYGVVNYWSWDFGDPTTAGDTSHIRNPVYTYHNAGSYPVNFIVATDKGCRDTLSPAITVTIVDKPDFRIMPKDTLICIVDTLAIHTNVSTGNITWSPNYAISDVHSFNPNVSPDVTTTYTAFYQDPYGCSITDSVRVHVTNGVTLTAMGDTTVCRTDQAQLHVASNALYYSWTPANLLNDSTLQNPIASPVDPLTDFHVHASISTKCFSDADIHVRSVPYPNVQLSGDSAICFGRSAQLHATGGSTYNWTPIAYLNNPHIADPISQIPKASIIYTVTVTDNLGCPKPVSAQFPVTVIRPTADAGPSDTSVVLGQPLQLNATGGTIYTWTPSTYLDNPNIHNPVSLPQTNITYLVRVSNPIGCTAFDTINVHVFDLLPGLYVPSAFTPGHDGLNDLFRPLALGISRLLYFRVFDRWGNLIYETNVINSGWDGTYKGKPLTTAGFVWQASAVDYHGKTLVRKGNVLLIR